MRLPLPPSMANAPSICGWEIAAFAAAAAAAVDVYVDIHMCLCVSRRETARARAWVFLAERARACVYFFINVWRWTGVSGRLVS